MNKDDILDAIRLTTAENGGVPLGVEKFTEKTGITKGNWLGKIWVKWSDAVKEAGYEPNTFSSPAYDVGCVIRTIAEYARELGHFPTKPELKIRHYNDKSFPSYTTLSKQLGSKSEVISKVAAYCKQDDSLESVHRMCESMVLNLPLSPKEE